ncbi:hypothetical protein KUCAC02_033742 [Chaenocephalus aceratus]|nr:hypothetical protein KUCAC02_033742 [Chaenocephalus aceratus]
MLELQTAGFKYPTTGAIEIITARPVRDLTASRPPAAASPRPAGLGERWLNVENRVNQEHVLERRTDVKVEVDQASRVLRGTHSKEAKNKQPLQDARLLR